jgi:DNA-binding FrmR family transcriptional regulator
MQDQTRTDALKRLNYIEGHLNGVKRMVIDNQYCVDILKQTYAIRKAIEKLEAKLLEGHLRSCVPESISHGETDKVVSELMALYELKPAFSAQGDESN